MGFFSILSGSFAELKKDPMLFLPKMISVTIWIFPYIFLMESMKADMLRMSFSIETWAAMALLMLLSPVWLVIDSMYPVLVEQRRRKGRLDFMAALRHVLSRLIPLILLFIAVMLIATACLLPFAAMVAFGLVLSLLPLIGLGILGGALLMFIGSLALYFVPTSVILEKAGFRDSFKKGFTLARGNFKLVFWLTLVSFLFLALAFILEGSLGALGLAGFVAGRYLGGIVTVYLYTVNPTAYLEMRPKKGKPIYI